MRNDDNRKIKNGISIFQSNVGPGLSAFICVYLRQMDFVFLVRVFRVFICGSTVLQGRGQAIEEVRQLARAIQS